MGSLQSRLVLHVYVAETAKAQPLVITVAPRLTQLQVIPYGKQKKPTKHNKWVGVNSHFMAIKAKNSPIYRGRFK